MTTTLIPAWENGTLKPIDKLEVHRKGLRHKAVSVFVMSGEMVLIQQRAASKYHTPGLWANTCCTHPHWEEPDLTCASRRLAEELGIADIDLQPVGQVEYRADVGGGLIEHELVEVFVADTATTLPIQLNPDEVQAVRWVNLHELVKETQRWPERFTPWLRIYLTEHMDQFFGPLLAQKANA